MNLDKRIKSKLDILSCFDIEKAKEFVGQKCYFANDLYCFSVVETCYYDTLTEVFKDGSSPFKDDDGCYWNLFIPESVLKPKPKEKKFRPYTIEEFQKIFTIGQPIKFRFKGINTEKTLLLIGYEIFYEDNNSEPYILIGYETFKLDELLEEYEWQESGSNVWKPFGVEE